MKPRIYLAGPDVFLPDALELAAAKKRLCAHYGLEGVFPLDVPLDEGVESRGLAPAELAYQISLTNEKLIRSCQVVVANMTPFRGPSADVGTAYEMGFARAAGLSVYAYSNDPDTFAHRTERFLGYFNMRGKDGSEHRDQHEMLIEAFPPLRDNLMLDGGVWHSTGTSVMTPKKAPSDLFRDLTNFETCLKHIAGVKDL